MTIVLSAAASYFPYTWYPYSRCLLSYPCCPMMAWKRQWTFHKSAFLAWWRPGDVTTCFLGCWIIPSTIKPLVPHGTYSTSSFSRSACQGITFIAHECSPPQQQSSLVSLFNFLILHSVRAVPGSVEVPSLNAQLYTDSSLVTEQFLQLSATTFHVWNRAAVSTGATQGCFQMVAECSWRLLLHQPCPCTTLQRPPSLGF